MHKIEVHFIYLWIKNLSITVEYCAEQVTFLAIQILNKSCSINKGTYLIIMCNILLNGNNNGTAVTVTVK